MNELTRTLDQVIVLANKARALAGPPTIQVNAGASLQLALDAAPPGATIVLEPGTWNESIRVWKPVAITSLQVLNGRAKKEAIGSWIYGVDDVITSLADEVSLFGIGARCTNPDRQLVAVTGARFVMDQCVAIGTEVAGQHRGLMLNGDTARVTRSTVDDCWNVGRDAQAVAGWDGTKHVVIDDCYLGGGAQSVMFGGADSKSADRIPFDITITRSTLSKNPAWFGKGASIKTALELKCVNGFLMQDCVLEWAGDSGGQGAYLMVLKSLNQDGTAPWSTVQNVLIERSLARFGGGAAIFVGIDGNNPAVLMDNIALRNVAFTDINPLNPYTHGGGRGFSFHRGPKQVQLEHCTLAGRNMAADMYFIEPPPTMMVLRDIRGILPKTSEYGIKIDAGGSGLAALQAWAPDAVIDISPLDKGAIGYPQP